MIRHLKHLLKAVSALLFAVERSQAQCKSGQQKQQNSSQQSSSQQMNGLQQQYQQMLVGMQQQQQNNLQTALRQQAQRNAYLTALQKNQQNLSGPQQQQLQYALQTALQQTQLLIAWQQQTGLTNQNPWITTLQQQIPLLSTLSPILQPAIRELT